MYPMMLAHTSHNLIKTSETLFGSMEKIGGAIPAQGMSTSIQTPRLLRQCTPTKGRVNKHLK